MSQLRVIVNGSLFSPSPSPSPFSPSLDPWEGGKSFGNIQDEQERQIQKVAQGLTWAQINLVTITATGNNWLVVWNIFYFPIYWE